MLGFACSALYLTHISLTDPEDAMATRTLHCDYEQPIGPDSVQSPILAILTFSSRLPIEMRSLLHDNLTK
jgi:hypothetical protein